EYLRQKYFPPVNLGQDLSLNCGECVYTINAPTGFVDYNWSTGETSSSITVNQSGIYSITVSDIFGFTSSDEIYVECPQQSCYPAPDLGNDIYVEYGFCPVQIEVEDIYQNYLWSNGDTQASTSVNTNGTYFITVTSLDGYTFIDSISVFYPEINMQDTVFCYSEHMILDPALEGDYSYLWSNSSMNPSIQVYNSGEYWVQITDTSNCEIIKTANVIVDNFQNNISLGNDTSLCSGNYIKLIEGTEETVNYTWLPGGETDSTLYVYENGEYILIAENINGCIARDTIVVDIQGVAPVPNFEAEQFCYGEPTLFTDLSFNQDSIENRTWIFNQTDTLFTADPSYGFTNIGMQEVMLQVESFSGCASDTTIYFDILETPLISISYLPICANIDVEFVSDVFVNEPNTIGSYNWEIDGQNVGDESNLIYSFDLADEYLLSLTVESSNDCVATYSETVDVQSEYPMPPSVDLISPENNVYSTEVSFKWSSSSDAIYYKLIVANDVNFNDIVFEKDSIYQNSYDVEFSQIETPLYWIIEAYNPCLTSNESLIGTFSYFTPESLEGLKLWLDADSVEVIENKVSSWYDKGPNSLNAVQEIEANMPLLIEDELNGQPVLRFNGISSYMQVDFNEIISQPSSIFIVYKISTEVAENIVFDNFGDDRFFFGRIPENQMCMNASIGYTTNVNYVDAGILPYTISTCLFDGTNSALFRNSSFEALGFAGNYSPEGLTIGGDRNLSPTFFLNGNIAEILFYNEILSEQDRNLVEEYLAYKYSPKLNLGPDIIVDYGVCGVEIGIDSNFDNILWSTGDTVDNIIVTQPGQYTVQASAFGRMQYDTININIPSPGYPEQTSFCSGNNIIWDTQMGNDYSFEWSLEGETDSQITINEEGFYSVLITDTIGCQLQSDTLYFEENMYEYTTSIGPSDTTMCSGNPLALITNIEETENYLWSTGSTEDQIIVTESGTYSVTTTNIVGCIAISQTNVTISGTAPQADFELLGQCEQNIISFTDLSVPTGEEIISWEWKINGDVFSQQQNPEYIFSEPGTYNISLTVTSEGGCSNTKTQSINIYPKPVVSFTPENLCQNSVNSIYSTSYVDNGTIQENYWYINGNQYTADQIDITVENDDSFEIKLISVSEHGCSDSIVSTIETRNNPIPQFTFSPICEGTSTYFNNNTQTEIYNPPLAYQWDFGDGGSSTISDPEYIYSASGEYDVSLEMSYNNGCSSTSTQTINVFANPSAEISNLNSCFGELYMPIDASVSEDGDIVSWKWVIERPELPSGYTTYYSQSPSFIPSDTGAYNIALTVNSEYGCTNTKNTSYNVWNSSIASFNASQTWGGVPFYVSFTNTSENAVDYFWDFGDDNTSTEQNTSHVYQDTGTFVVKLISFSENDCSDTASLQLNAVIPVLDILLLDFQVENVNNYLNCNVIVVNNGTLPVSNIEMIITIPSKGTFREILDYIEPGETINYTFDTEIYYQGNGLPEIICVEAKPDIISNYYQDENPEDNVICLSSLNQLRAYPPYPNPADELLYFEFFSNQNSDIIIKMINGNGQIISSYSLISFYGYKKLELNLSNTPSGLYFLNITNGEEQFSYKFIKN
ncbi:MAG: PKD domain-containing protein, partial [Bacteroidales bacterium]|nr:PKD domain-containing protein [Bacteroidales bacterium]